MKAKETLDFIVKHPLRSALALGSLGLGVYGGFSGDAGAGFISDLFVVGFAGYVAQISPLLNRIGIPVLNSKRTDLGNIPDEDFDIFFNPVPPVINCALYSAGFGIGKGLEYLCK